MKETLFPPSNAKRNIIEIAFLERLEGSHKSASDRDVSLVAGISPPCSAPGAEEMQRDQAAPPATMKE